MTTITVLKFEQIGHEEFKTIPYTKKFRSDTTLYDVLNWVQSIDINKSLSDIYINDKY